MSDEQSSKRPRVLQACEACRDAKLRCDLGDPGAPKDPPCRRCSRSGRECRFVGSHLHSKPRKMRRRANINRSEPSASVSPPVRANVTSPLARGQPIYFGSNLETPADALRILCEAADEERIPVPPKEPAGRIWGRWGPVRDGLLTAEEAGSLLAFFVQHLSPLHPVVPVRLLNSDHFSELLDEPVLLSAIALAASRFHDLGASFDAAEPSRSKVIQGKLVAWVLARLGYISMGDPTFRTIGTVEALLVLSEWPPRGLLLKDPAGAATQANSPPSACKLFDDLSWTLTGLALRIAQELSIDDETTFTAEWHTQRRIDAWINCLSADRHVSVRLGRASLLQAKMSTNWWHALSNLMFEGGPHSFRNLSDPSWRETQVISELTHNLGLLQETLYASPELTADLIRTRRFEPILHRLKPELDSLMQWIAPKSIERDVLEDSVPGMEAEELRDIRMRIEVDYVRLYANAMSMRAAHARLSEKLKTSDGDRVFEGSVLRWAEAPFLLEVVAAAMSLMKCGVTLHRRGVLRYCPGRIFLRLMFAAVFLMKALSFGALVEPEAEVVELEYSLIDAFRDAAVDDDHLASQLASLLTRLFPLRPDEESQPDPMSFLNFDLAATGVVDMSAFAAALGIDPENLEGSAGFNPGGLVPLIEAMLAPQEFDMQ